MILLTGAAGVTGSEIAKRLSAQGARSRATWPRRRPSCRPRSRSAGRPRSADNPRAGARWRRDGFPASAQRSAPRGVSGQSCRNAPSTSGDSEGGTSCERARPVLAGGVGLLETLKEREGADELGSVARPHRAGAPRGAGPVGGAGRGSRLRDLRPPRGGDRRRAAREARRGAGRSRRPLHDQSDTLLGGALRQLVGRGGRRSNQCQAPPQGGCVDPSGIRGPRWPSSRPTWATRWRRI